MLQAKALQLVTIAVVLKKSQLNCVKKSQLNCVKKEPRMFSAESYNKFIEILWLKFNRLTDNEDRVLKGTRANLKGLAK